MPLYEYKCKVCEKKFEVIEGFDGGTTECIHCSSNEIKKVIHAPHVIFKGSGFYETEYGKQKHNHSNSEDRDKISETEKIASSKDDKKDAPKSDSGSKGNSTSSKSDSSPKT
ncbi:zinc ribbon domain-containing protein [bacterium]|nr:zinc ribbon domain-containing protein [bacterium]